ncbi:MAG TPA: energy transducer TonB [Allosphingosinicella sp.]|jgi:protein TonB
MRNPFIVLALPLLVGAGHDLSSRANVNLAPLISSEDYPPSALRSGAQGSVGFVLDIGPDGRVANCTIESSSGTPALDSTTCRLLTARGLFTPARDRRGRPTTDRIHSRIRWALPQMTPPPPSTPS